MIPSSSSLPRSASGTTVVGELSQSSNIKWMNLMKDSLAGSASSALPSQQISGGLTLLLACACGLIAANIYYAQPLIGLISDDLEMPRSAAGLIVTLTQVGYGLGLLLVVPLADMFENRRLAIAVLFVAVLGLVLSGLSTLTALFLAAAVLLGLGSVTVQILVPYAAHLAPEESRGRVVGNVMSGLMFGIMMARPLASLITYYFSWRMVFFFSLAVMLAVVLALRFLMPKRPVCAGIGYGRMLFSMAGLLRRSPELRRRSFYQACMFGAFSLFWTTVPLRLASPEFGLSQRGIALFALAGVAGAIAAPIAGRVADKGLVKQATAVMMLMAIAAFAMSHAGESGSTFALAMLVLSGIVLDFAVAANLVLGQRVIFSLAPELRGRLNGLYMTLFFCGGALGSALGGWSYAICGWSGASALGLAFVIAGLACFLTER